MDLAGKFNLTMGLRAKFNLVILAAFAVGFLVAAIALNRVFANNARDQVLQNARIMMTAANAIRNYTAEELVPLLPTERGGKFVPETVPAYAAQKNFKDVHAAFTALYVSGAHAQSDQSVGPRAGLGGRHHRPVPQRAVEAGADCRARYAGRTDAQHGASDRGPRRSLPCLP